MLPVSSYRLLQSFDKPSESNSSLFCILIYTGAFQNPDKHFSYFFLQNGMNVTLCNFIGAYPCIHPVCVLFDLRITADILFFKDILFQKSHFFFQPRWKNSQSHYFDQADIFLLYMVKVCRRMIYTPRALIRCSVVSKHQIQLIRIAAPSCNRSDRIVRCSVCFTKNESLRQFFNISL